MADVPIQAAGRTLDITGNLDDPANAQPEIDKIDDGVKPPVGQVDPPSPPLAGTLDITGPLDDPAKAQAEIDKIGDDVKPPVGKGDPHAGAGFTLDITGAPDPAKAQAEIAKIGDYVKTPVGQTVAYNSGQAQDGTRQTITLWLVGLLCSIVALAFVTLFASGAASGFAESNFFDNFKKILDVILPPVSTLLASTIGFYFGNKQGDSATADKKPLQGTSQ